MTKALNDLARHQAITRVYADILRDMQVCEIKGWDRMEYVRMLRHLLDTLGNGIGTKRSRTHEEEINHMA